MFEITTSPNNMKCVEIEYPTENERNFIRNAVLENRIEHPAYVAARSGIPFLQSDHEDYLLVEFWGRRPEPFVYYLNSHFKSSVK